MRRAEVRNPVALLLVIRPCNASFWIREMNIGNEIKLDAQISYFGRYFT